MQGRSMALMAMVAAFALAQPEMAFGQAAADVADLVGARAAGGETQLEARGYSFITANVVRDTKWSFWWSERQRQCISVATSDGRYASINAVPDANCRTAAANAAPRDVAGPGPGAGAGAGRDDLTLICFGGGSGPAAQSYSGYRYNSKSRKFEPEFGTTLTREGFSSDVQLEISGGRGRIHLSGKLVSPIHSGGSDGWWPIEELVVTPDRIIGTYRLNGLNKPRLEIDRRTRAISIRAATNFSGRCDIGSWRSEGF